jgi:hypothetical protein
MSGAAKIYLALAAAVAIILWAYQSRGIAPNVTETPGTLNMGGTS